MKSPYRIFYRFFIEDLKTPWKLGPILILNKNKNLGCVQCFTVIESVSMCFKNEWDLGIWEMCLKIVWDFDT